MTSRLVQKRLFKETREFEIIDDTVTVRIKTPFKEKELSVVFTILNPEPVIEDGFLHFHSRVKCGPLLSLYLNKPNPAEFNAFVEELKRRAQAYSVFLGDGQATRPQAPGGNSVDEPPEFVDFGQDRKATHRKDVNVDRVETSIQMLDQYLGAEDIRPLVAALEALKSEPQNPSRMAQLAEAFNDLGLLQGAVLTYAPYIGILLSDDPFGDS
ncbi:MAG: hypothetical protein U5S82_04045 [Gammaproteobacteria bacterium]|nr:hypothetical protein [Gammaproteobacteria bacterium]